MEYMIVNAIALQTIIDKEGLSQRALAAKTGLNPGYINLLCTGARKTCSAKTAKSISEALGVNMGAIFFAPSVQKSERVSAKSGVIG